MLRHVESCAKVLESYRVSSENDFKRKYKIIMNKDGSIFDTVIKKRYNNLSHWVNSIKELKHEVY